MIEAKDLSTKRLVARLGLRAFIIALLGAFFIFLLGPTMHYFGPFIWAYIVTAICLFPILKRLSKRLVKFWSIILVVLMLAVILLIVGGIVFYITAEVLDIVKNWDHYQSTLDQAVLRIANFIDAHSNIKAEKAQDFMYNIGNTIVDYVKHNSKEHSGVIVKTVGHYLPSVGSILLAFLFFLMATYFVCAEYPKINEGIKKIMPDSIENQLRTIKDCVGSAAFGYLKAQVIISSLVALIAFIVFVVIGQKYALVWAIAVGLIDFIPMLGSSVVLVPWIIILVAMGDMTKAIIYAILTFVLFMFRRITEPKIVGSQTGLHPLLTLIALFIGIKVGGLFGMIVAPIVLMMFVNLYKCGFFTPTISDIKEIFYRCAVFVGMNITVKEQAPDNSAKEKNDSE